MPHDHSGGSSRPRRRLLPMLALGTAVLLSAALVILTQRDHRDAAAQRSRAVSLGHQLGHERQKVADLTARLGAVDLQDRKLGASLRQTRAALQSASGWLQAALQESGADAASISDLQSCLGGLQAALNQISVGDQTGAETSLAGVTAACTRASSTG